MLRTRGECSLPGMGTLKLRKTSAQIKEGHISAPNWSLDWTSNSQLKQDALLERIMQEENLNAEDAHKALTQWLEQVQAGAKTAQGYSLEGLGIFLFEKGQWAFKSGLEKWRVKEAKWKKAVAETETVTETGAVTDKEAETEAESTEGGVGVGETVRVGVDDGESNGGGDPENVSNNNTTLWVVVISLLLLIGAGFFYWNSQQNTNQEPIDEVTEPAPMPVPEPVSMDTASILNNTDSLQTTSDSASTIATPTTTNASGTYDIVVFKYNNQARAEKQVAKYLRNGNVSRMVASVDSQYLVIIQAQTTQPDTAKIVDSIRAFFNPKGRLYILK
ncbi:MAG: hypothetical protein ACR2IL_08075 [Chitinophagaceae bacterium]